MSRWRPDRLLGVLGVVMRLGVGDAPVEQPAAHLLVALEAQPRREEALAHEPDLVLDLPLLLSGRRSARGGLDEVVPAHREETAVVATVLADEDGLDRRLPMLS
jgi:hypothetical protein